MQDLIDGGAKAVFVAVGLPEPKVDTELFCVGDGVVLGPAQGAWTSKSLLPAVSRYAKRLPVANDAQCSNGRCGGGTCGSSAGCSTTTVSVPDFRGKRVIVLGAGDTAMDCATAALRCGARRVQVAFRRGTPDVRAVPEELALAVKERVELMPYAQPVRILVHGSTSSAPGRVRAVVFRRTDKDDDGRWTTAVGDGDDDADEMTLRADAVVSAFGSRVSQDREYRIRVVVIRAVPKIYEARGNTISRSLLF